MVFQMLKHQIKTTEKDSRKCFPLLQGKVYQKQGKFVKHRLASLWALSAEPLCHPSMSVPLQVQPHLLIGINCTTLQLQGRESQHCDYGRICSAVHLAKQVTKAPMENISPETKLYHQNTSPKLNCTTFHVTAL